MPTPAFQKLCRVMEDRLGRLLTEIELIQLKMALTLAPVDTESSPIEYWETLLKLRPSTFLKTGIVADLNDETIARLTKELQKQTRISTRTRKFESPE